MIDKEIQEVETVLETTKETNLEVIDGNLGIKGLEEVPSSIMPIPYLRLVQPTSMKVNTIKGKDAEAGTFYFNDIQQSFESVEFALIKAKYGMQSFERDGVMQDSVKLAILGMTLTTSKLFVITLSSTSFTNFGSLIAKMKEAGITKSWQHKIILSSEKQENDKGKYYTARFELGEKLSDKQIEELELKHEQYGMVLDRKNPQSEVDL